jgi:hypothetical protein
MDANLAVRVKQISKSPPTFADRVLRFQSAAIQKSNEKQSTGIMAHTPPNFS